MVEMYKFTAICIPTDEAECKRIHKDSTDIKFLNKEILYILLKDTNVCVHACTCACTHTDTNVNYNKIHGNENHQI